jgi:hypothetical protein
MVGEPIPYPWTIAVYLPCGQVQFHFRRGDVWRSRAAAQQWADHVMHCTPCLYVRPVPVPLTGTC